MTEFTLHTCRRGLGRPWLLYQSLVGGRSFGTRWPATDEASLGRCPPSVPASPAGTWGSAPVSWKGRGGRRRYWGDRTEEALAMFCESTVRVLLGEGGSWSRGPRVSERRERSNIC